MKEHTRAYDDMQTVRRAGDALQYLYENDILKTNKMLERDVTKFIDLAGHCRWKHNYGFYGETLVRVYGFKKISDGVYSKKVPGGKVIARNPKYLFNCIAWKFTYKHGFLNLKEDTEYAEWQDEIDEAFRKFGLYVEPKTLGEVVGDGYAFGCCMTEEL